MEANKKKITKATFKAFIKRNKEKLFVQVQSTFDGMVDCVVEMCHKMSPAQFNQGFAENTLGIAGVWLVGRSRDSFYAWEDGMFTGYKVSNSCGSFVVATLKSK